METSVARNSNKNNLVGGNPFLLRLYEPELAWMREAIDRPLMDLAERARKGEIKSAIELDWALLCAGKTQIYQRILCACGACIGDLGVIEYTPRRFRVEHAAAAKEHLERSIVLREPGRIELHDEPISLAEEEFMLHPCCAAHAVTYSNNKKALLAHWASLEHCCYQRGLKTIPDLAVARALAVTHGHILLSTPSPLVAAWHIYRSRCIHRKKYIPSDRILFLFQKLIGRAQPGLADVLEIWRCDELRKSIHNGALPSLEQC